jgi:hypothetical protein
MATIRFFILMLICHIADDSKSNLISRRAIDQVV